jgi:hypothetical protein
MGIEFSSGIAPFQVDQSLVDVTDYLEVIGGPHELYTGESTGGNDAGTAARLCAPCNFFAFCIGDYGIRFRGCP